MVRDRHRGSVGATQLALEAHIQGVSPPFRGLESGRHRQFVEPYFDTLTPQARRIEFGALP